MHKVSGLQDICCWNDGILLAAYRSYVTLTGHNPCTIDIIPPPNHLSSQLNWIHLLCSVHHASRYNRVKKNQLDAQLILSIFRHPLHVSGVSWPIIRRYNRMYTKIGTYYSFYCGPDSVVGIATGYRLDGPGIESQWRRDFPHLSRPALGPTQPPAQWVRGLSRGRSVTGAWRWPLTPF